MQVLTRQEYHQHSLLGHHRSPPEKCGKVQTSDQIREKVAESKEDGLRRNFGFWRKYSHVLN
jgi:hypothetical protein